MTARLWRKASSFNKSPDNSPGRNGLSCLQILVQIAPCGIHVIDEVNLFLTGTSLDLLLACYGSVNIFSTLMEDQLVHVVSTRKTWYQPLTVLKDTPLEIAGHTGAEDFVVPIR
jgi:hypothetical protein